MTDTTTQMRAILLAALTVLSAVAGTAAFAGTAAATVTNVTNLTATDVAADDTGAVQKVRLTVVDDGTGGNVTLDFPDEVTVQSATTSTGAPATVTGSSRLTLEDVDNGTVTVTLTQDTSAISDPVEDLSLVVRDDDGDPLNSTTFDAVADLDEFVSGGMTFWKGQQLYFEGDADATYQIREWDDDDGEVGTLVTEFATDDDGRNVVDTGLEILDTGQEYVITTDSREVVTVNDLGRQTAVVEAPTDETVNPWEVQRQVLTASWDQDSVNAEQGESADLELTSNRGTYDVLVSADSGLDGQDLAEIFGVDESAVDEADEAVRIDDVASVGTISGNFTGVDDDSYNFTVEVVDTGVEDEVSIDVTEAEGELDLPNSMVIEERGDVATVTVDLSNTETGYVEVGSDEVGYEVTLEVEDGGDDQVSFELNTFDAGMAGSSWADSDDAEALNVSDEEDAYELTEESDDDGDDLDVVGVHSEPLNDPLDAGLYDVQVGVGVENAAGTATYEGGEALDTAQDVTSIDLTERGTQGVTVWTAPSDADADELGELRPRLTSSSRVARNDYVVVQLRATGVFGQFEEDDPEMLAQDGLELTIEEADPGPNQDPEAMDVDSDAVEELFLDPANDSVFVVVEASGTRGGLSFEEDEQYAGTWELTSENPMLEEDLDRAGQESEEAESVFTLTERDATIDGATADQFLELPAANATIRGDTTVAPGTELEVRVRGRTDDRAYIESARTVVADNRTFSATVDMSDIDVGTNFTVVVRASGDELSDEYDGTVIQQETPTPTPTPVETTFTPEPTPTPTPEPTPTATPEPTPTATPSPTPTPTPAPVPGFGVGLAVVALAGAALLAGRRA